MKPYKKAQTIRYVGLQDRRRKLTDDDRALILKLHREQGATYRGLARQFGVSRSLVRFICDDDARERNRARIKATWRKYREQRSKEENAKIIRTWRRRKYKMYVANELTEKYVPPVPRVAVPNKTVRAKKPDGEIIVVRVPVSYANGEGPDVRLGRAWRIVRRDGKFYATPRTGE